MLAIDFMPARLAHIGDALAHRDAVEILGELPLVRAVNLKAVASEFAAERGRIALEPGVRHMMRVGAAVCVSEPYLLAPRAPLRVTALAQHLERWADPSLLNARVLAPSQLDLLREAIGGVHRERAV
jgi:hypothetical protein